jgi:dipeptidyl-peptidase-4
VTEQSSQSNYPRQSARTRRYTLGAPRAVRVSRDGRRVVFLRSGSGTDPVNGLWVLDVETGREHQVVDAHALLSGGEESLTGEERARRERARESAGGVTSYAVDPECRLAAFALSGRLFVADLTSEGGPHPVRELAAAGPVFDPRPDPTARRVAYTTGGALHVVDVDSGKDRRLAAEDGDDVTWGLAEFVAAEEMDRTRGFWWSPDGGALLAARVDTGPVQRWHVADPNRPERSPTVLAYPAAGTANADVTLAVLARDGSGVDVTWDREALPYLADADWSEEGGLVLVVQSRDQRTVQVLRADPASGRTELLLEENDPVWVDLVGLPSWLDDGRLVWLRDLDDTRRLLVGAVPVTPPGLQVRRVVGVSDDEVVFTASDDPVETHVWVWSEQEGVRRLTTEPGLHSASVGGTVRVLTSVGLNHAGSTTQVWREDERVARLASLAETPVLTPRVELLRLGERELRAALLLPTSYDPADGPLPVLLDPYGGPHAQRVVAASGAYLTSQWFADQGFAVLVADGRGTPGRGPAWERAVTGDLATAPLQDQVDALQAAVAARPDVLDPSRVGIRGWSFGGYLAALAVLRRPDAVHAAVAGAPVTDWTLYDTHYTERYLGTETAASSYVRSSLLHDAPTLSRPLLLIHGLADDNVVAAHTLRLSQALLEAGRAHSVLPLSGVTHMTPQEAVAENLLLLQVEWLRDALRLPARTSWTGPAAQPG